MQVRALGLVLTLLLCAAAADAALPGTGASPQLALLSAYRGVRPQPAVLRVNVAGAFAVVLARGAFPEQIAHTATPAYLIERFAFGWQPLDVLLDSCLMDFRGISAADQRRLLEGMPRLPHFADACNVERRDIGSPRDIAALRARMTGPLVPSVVISGQYAYAQEYGDGGSCALFRRSRSGWTLLSVCKGSLDPAVTAKIPTATLCALRLGEYARAKCPGR